MQGRLFAHYIIPAVPALAILAGPGLVNTPRKALAGFATAVVLTISVTAAWQAGAPDARESATQRVGAAVAQMTKPGDRILVWDSRRTSTSPPIVPRPASTCTSLP